MPKRQPISFPELEGRGRNAILRSAAEVQSEEALLASQHASRPASRQPGPPADQIAGAVQPVPRSQFAKATYRLSPTALEAMEDMKRLLRRRFNLRVSFEEIAEEAILAAAHDLENRQQDSFLVRQLASNPAPREGS